MDAYWSWMEQRILAPIKEQFPELYDWLVDWYKQRIAEAADDALTDEDAS
jgi:hypothetical protein